MGEARFLSVLTVLLLAGCATPDGDSAAQNPGTDSGDGTTALTAPPETVLIDRERPFDPINEGDEGDILCALGGSPELTRPEEEPKPLILPGVTKLAFHVKGANANTGIQLGYAFEDNETTWLPVAHVEDSYQEVPVEPTQYETNEYRWHFFLRQSVTGRPEECHTGYSAQSHVRILALAEQ